MDAADVVIIGGGVVGCAVAMALAREWANVFLLEAMPRVGMAASSRNSGVIHSGIYYPSGSLKARHCVRGNRLAYEFCAAHRVSHRRVGKIVVATESSQENRLEELFQRGRANGVEGLRLLDQAGLRVREPHVAGCAALEVPSTGIVSGEELVKTCARMATEQGANLVTRARVERLLPTAVGIRVISTAGEIEARCVVNSAGLFADDVAAMLGSLLAVYRIYPVRGEYCELVRSKSHLVRGLAYPLPASDGLSLGCHLTRTIADTVLAGPTARRVIDKNDYENDLEPVESFVRRIQYLLPDVTASDLRPVYSGIRATLVPLGKKGPADFIIQHDPQIPRVIHLMGIDSPGLTSALSIAEQVTLMVREALA
jgi:L-2-hydroxyglutarate oxidase LhgO